MKYDRVNYDRYFFINTTLKRIISNLLNNAVESISEAGEVKILFNKMEDRFFQIIISDNGKGTASDVLSQPTQKDVSFGKSNGSGLGLYHARISLESWGGSLKIESTLGVGTQVILAIPGNRLSDVI